MRTTPHCSLVKGNDKCANGFTAIICNSCLCLMEDEASNKKRSAAGDKNMDTAVVWKQLMLHKKHLSYHARQNQKVGGAAYKFVKKAVLAGLETDEDLKFIIKKAKKEVKWCLQEEQHAVADNLLGDEVEGEKKRGNKHAIIEEK